MKVIFHSYLINVTKEETIELDFTGTFRELLDLLCEKYGSCFESLILSDSKPSPKAVILINNCFLNKEKGLEWIIHNTDVVTFIPIVAGG
mgnify:CR=1 FL=1|jgi:molybdopterin converting factor small subunit